MPFDKTGLIQLNIGGVLPDKIAISHCDISNGINEMMKELMERHLLLKTCWI